jgi:hypothetical protein
MTSIFQRALGSEFWNLHPELQRRFGFSSTDGTACVGMGVMDEIWRGPACTVPFLALGASRNILFPERGNHVPFTIENYAYVDGHGRETVTFVRTFEFNPARRRRFDATMVYAEQRGRVLDFLGTHQHLAVELELRVDDEGGLHVRTAEQRFLEGGLNVRLPESLSGVAELHEWFDDRTQRFGIDVRVTNRHVGPVFGYRGTFVATYVDTRTTPVPAAVRPRRERLAA